VQCICSFAGCWGGPRTCPHHPDCKAVWNERASESPKRAAHTECSVREDAWVLLAPASVLDALQTQSVRMWAACCFLQALFSCLPTFAIFLQLLSYNLQNLIQENNLLFVFACMLWPKYCFSWIVTISSGLSIYFTASYCMFIELLMFLFGPAERVMNQTMFDVPNPLVVHVLLFNMSLCITIFASLPPSFLVSSVWQMFSNMKFMCSKHTDDDPPSLI